MATKKIHGIEVASAVTRVALAVPQGPGSQAVLGALVECEATIRQIASGPL